MAERTAERTAERRVATAGSNQVNLTKVLLLKVVLEVPEPMTTILMLDNTFHFDILG